MKKRFLNVIVCVGVIFASCFSNATYIVAKDNETPSFYEDFSSDDSFIGISNGTFYIDDNKGCLVSDNFYTNCVAEIGGSDILWSDFELQIDIRPRRSDSSSGLIKLLTRRNANRFVGIIIRPGVENGFRYYTSSIGETVLSESNAMLDFEKDYTIRMVMNGSNTSLYYKEKSANEFILVSEFTVADSVEGSIAISTYGTVAEFDNIAIWDTSISPIGFEQKIIKMENGTKEQLVPFVSSGMTDILYTSSNNSAVKVSTNGLVEAVGSGKSTITLTAKRGGITYNTKINVIVTVPVKGVGFNTAGITVYEGETININGIVLPDSATNKRLIWSSSDDDSLDIEGNHPSVRSLVAQKTGNVYVTIKSQENENITKSLSINILPRPTEAKMKSFTEKKKRVIPSDYFGVCYYDPVAMIKRGDNKQKILAQDEQAADNILNLKFKHIRWLMGDYGILDGSYPGIPTTTDKYTISDMYKNSNELKIPMCVTTGRNDSPDEIIEFIKEIRKHTSMPIYIEMANEPYNLNEQTIFPSVEDYIQKTRTVYNAVKDTVDDVKIAVSIAEPYLYQNSKAAYEQNPVPGSQAERIVKWNEGILNNSDCYDALAIHLYSNASLEMLTSDKIMDTFSQNAAQNLDRLSSIDEVLQGKEYWITEYGDLPNIFSIQNNIFSAKSESDRARIQYMKSLGNSIGYIETVLKLLDNPSVKLAAYHILNDSQGFGIYQDENNYAMPHAYAFAMLGGVIENNRYYYTISGENELTVKYKYGNEVEYSRVNCFGFGDDKEIRQVVFTNTTNEPMLVSLNGKELSKEWQYSDENPLTDFGKQTEGSWLSVPSVVPKPTTFVNTEYDTFIEVAPYSITLVNVRDMTDKRLLVYEDFSDNTAKDFVINGQTINDGKMFMPNNSVFKTKEDYSDFVLEFDYKTDDTSKSALAYVEFGRNEDLKRFCQIMLYYNELYRADSVCLQSWFKLGGDSSGGWMENNTFGKLESGKTYRFRFEKIADTLCIYAKDLLDHDGVYKLVGSQKNIEFLTNGAGKIQIISKTENGGWLDNIIIYHVVPDAQADGIELYDVVAKDINGEIIKTNSFNDETINVCAKIDTNGKDIDFDCARAICGIYDKTQDQHILKCVQLLDVDLSGKDGVFNIEFDPCYVSDMDNMQIKVMLWNNITPLSQYSEYQY